MSTVLRDGMVVTRKPHYCWGCIKEIPPKTTTHCQTNVDGNDIYTIYICEICDEVLSKIDNCDIGELLEGDLINTDEYINYMNQEK